MANETGLDSTGISTAVPAWLRARALKARYAASKVWKHCLNGIEGDPMVKGNITRAGDRVTFQIFPELTPSDISTTDGTFTDTEISPTAKSVTINKWKNVSANLVDIVEAQAILQWEAEFADAFGKAISQIQDSDILDLVPSLGSYTIQDAGPMSDSKVLLAQRYLDDGDVPKDDRCWVLAPVAHADLMAIDKFTLANTTGFSRGIQVGDGRIVGLYGTPVEVSTEVYTTSSKRDNVLFHRECFGVVMQKDFKMEKFARTKYATNYAGSALYGVAELRDDHGVWVQSAA